MTPARLIGLAALLASVSSYAFAANDIGAVSAVNRDVAGTPPADQKRNLALGDGVVQDELIESSPLGSGQLMFRDQTTMTIAKNSAIVLDQYIYNPDTRTGTITMSMSKGVLRFIGGRITKETDAVIVTPTATIGIRGGMAIITVDEDGTTRAMHIAGEYTKISANDGDSVVVTRNNGVGLIGPSGFGVSYLGVADREYVAELSRLLIGRGEAGAAQRPQNPDVVDSGIVVRNSEAKGITATAAQSTTGEQIEVEEGDDDDFLFPRTEEEVQTAVATLPDPPPEPPQPPQPPEPPEPPTPEPPTPEPPTPEPPTPEPPTPEPPTPEPERTLLEGVTGSASLSSEGVDGLTSGAGDTFVFTQVFDGSRIGVTAAGEEFSIPTPDTAGFFSFDGTGSSPAGALSGSGFFDPDAEFTFVAVEAADGRPGAFLSGLPTGALTGAGAGTVTTRRYSLSADLISNGAAFLPDQLSAFDGTGVSDLILLSTPEGAAAGGSARVASGYLNVIGEGPGQQTGFGVLSGDVAASGNGGPSIASFFQGVFTDGNGGSSFVTNGVATVSDGQGGEAFGEDAQFLALGNTGDFGAGVQTLAGTSVTEAGATTLFGSNTLAQQTSVGTIATTSRNGLGATLNGYAAVAAVGSGPGDFAITNLSPNDVQIDIDPALNNASASFNLFQVVGGDQTANAQVFGITANFGGDGGTSAYVDDQTFVARGAATDSGALNETDATFSGALATGGLVGDAGLFPAGAAIPQHLTWGWWSGSLDGGDTQAADIRDQNLHLGAWIAGDITASANLPVGGVATYDGIAALSAVDNGRAFVDGAGFQMTYDFGNGLGTVQFNDLLGDNPVIAVNEFTSNGGNYTGTAGITALGRDGLISVDGAFFNAGNTPAGATGGAVVVQTLDGGLKGTGVFGGDRSSFTPPVID